MMVSVSRVTVSAGISTEISRLTPSFLISSVVSVGLTDTFQCPANSGPAAPFPRAKGAQPNSFALILSVKTGGEQRQTAGGHLVPESFVPAHKRNLAEPLLCEMSIVDLETVVKL